MPRPSRRTKGGNPIATVYPRDGISIKEPTASMDDFSSSREPIHEKSSVGARGGALKYLVLIGVAFAALEVYLRGREFLQSGGVGGTRVASTRGAITPTHSDRCLDLQAGVDPVAPTDRYYPDPQREPDKCQLYTEPTPYIALLMKAVAGFPNHGTCADYSTCTTYGPYNPTHRLYGLDWPPFGYTMVGFQRLENFRAAIEEVNRNHIPGDVMELGVWRGGAMILATAVSKEYRSLGGTMERKMYVLDAFEDIPAQAYGGSGAFLFNTEQDVRSHFQLYNVLDDNVIFKRGLFKDTVPEMATIVQQIAVLRVDGNFYDSYQDSLYYLYEKVPVGGIVIFDDVMSHPPVLQCWRDFKADQGLPETLNRIDVHSAWFRKTKEIKIDFSKMRPPQDVNLQ